MFNFRPVGVGPDSRGSEEKQRKRTGKQYWCICSNYPHESYHLNKHCTGLSYLVVGWGWGESRGQ